LPWFKGLFGSFDWTRAARRLWEWLLNPTHGGQKRFKVPDWKLAEALGVQRRCIQKALWFLEHVAGVITRSREYGHGNYGRVIEIVIHFRGPKAKPEARPKAREKPAAAPIPNVGTVAPATPAQLAAAAAQIAAAQAGPPRPAEEDPAVQAQVDEFRARGRAFAAKARELEQQRKAQAARLVNPAPKKTPEQVKAQIDAAAARRARADAGSTGPPDPGTPPDPTGP
jgi:hypothetical protein